MSKRRGGAPAAATGFLWRQQQERVALAEALKRLPGADAPPQRLLRGLQRALLCVQHTLGGAPGGRDVAVGIGDGDVAVGTGDRDVAVGTGDGDVAVGTGDGDVAVGTGDGVADAVVGAAALEGDGVAGAEARGREQRLEGVLGACDTQRGLAVDLAAKRAAEELRQLLAVELSEVHATPAATEAAALDGAAFVPALLHHLLALSSDLFDLGTDGEAQAPGVLNIPAAAACGVSAGGAIALRRDELAVAARLRPPVAVYVRIVVGMRWEEQLLDLLAWVPDPRVAAAAAGRALRACPDLAPGLAAALAAGLRCAEAGGDVGAAGEAAGLEAPRGEGCKGAGAWWRPAGGAASLAESPAVLARIAEAVRQAATAAAAADTGGGGGDSDSGGGGKGARWLPCLLLLAHGLLAALQAPAAADTEPHTSPPSGPRFSGGGGVDGAEDWPAACCEALQEGLCAWQDSLGPASDAQRRKLLLAAAAPQALLLPLLRDRLLPLLDEQARAHIATQLQQQQEAPARGSAGTTPAPRRPLLPYASAIRLRSRIALLALGAPPGPTRLGAAAGEECTGPERAGANVPELTVDHVWKDLPSGGSSRVAAASTAAQPGQGAGREGIPDWLRAATSTARTARRMCLPGVSPQPGLSPQPPLAATRPAVSRAGGAAATGGPALATARVAAVAVALLTPGVASWLSAQADPRVAAASGPDPYSPFRAALALLELLQGELTLRPPGEALADTLGPAPETHSGGGGGDGGSQPASDPSLVEDGLAAAEHAKQEPEAQRAGAAGDRRRRLCLLVLRMAAECIACVAAAEQQAALQAVLLASPAFESLQAHLAADAPLQAAAGRALVALSNRSAALEGSLERLALSAAAEAQRLAATSRALLPFAALAPAACVRRLVLDGLAHPGQQPWVLQLLSSSAAAAAAAPAAPPAALRAAGGSGASGPAPALLTCLQDMLRDAARLLRSPADRRSLLGLLDGALRCGVAAPSQLLAGLALPALEAARRAEGGRLAAAQAHAALLVAQLVLGGTDSSATGSGPGAVQLPPRQYDPAAALAAARPAALLLAVAATLEQLYDEYGSRGQLEAAVIDAAVGVLERGVQLYGTHLAVRGGTARGSGERGRLGEPERAELAELVAGCEALPRRLVAVLLPVLEMASASAAADAGSDEGSEPEADDGGGGALFRSLVSRLAPAAQWRPRSLRGADPRVAHAAVYDTLAFAASSAANASAVRSALLEAAVADADGDADKAGGNEDVAGTGEAGAAVWAAWGCDALTARAETAPQPQPLPPPPTTTTTTGRECGSSTGWVARHVAATAARGLPQLPPARLAAALVSGLAELLPTASQEQARRVLLVVLPALVRGAGGAAQLASAMRSGADGAAGTAVQRLSAEPGPGATQAQSAGDGGAGGGVGAGDKDAVLGMLGEVLERELSREQAPAEVAAGGAAGAAEVALAAALACRAATAALRAAAGPRSQAALPEGGTRGEAATGAAGNPAAPGATADAATPRVAVAVAVAAAVAATADRCAAHLSLLAAQLATVVAHARGQQRQQLLARRGRAGDADVWPQVVAVASVLLAEMCGVAAAAAEAADATSAGSAARGMDVWLAIMLSVLQQLVSALTAALGRAAATAAAPAGGGPTLGPSMAGASAVADVSDGEWVHATLHRLARALRILPGTAAHVLWDALERLCEEQELGSGVGEAGQEDDRARGVLLEALRAVEFTVAI